jgi:hypothetical protein
MAVLGASSLQIDSATLGSQTGSAPMFAARAWVNFNGTTSPGTIRGNGNVSSVARNGNGDYTVTFTTAMPDGNYNVCGTSIDPTVGNSMICGVPSAALSTSNVRFGVRDGGNGLRNSVTVSISTFR